MATPCRPVRVRLSRQVERQGQVIAGPASHDDPIAVQPGGEMDGKWCSLPTPPLELATTIIM